MNRSSLLQFLISKYDYSTYLEIGTQKGVSFFPIKCNLKIAVDPVFLIEPKDKLKWLFKNPYNFRNKYFEMTSDDFFLKYERFLQGEGRPDIVFIDGLHTFKATLKDILNSLRVISRTGTIVVHDCFPPHKAAAEPGTDAEEVALRSSRIQGWTGEWCGDSWKAIAYLRKKYKEKLRVVVLNSDYGLGVVQISSNLPLDLDIDYKIFELVDSLQYEDMIKKPQDVIGLSNSEEHKDL